MFAVEMTAITKQFGNLIANDSIDFKVRKGEIHALVGENGAGKSTLMNILYGMHRPDSGRIKINGVETKITSSKEAINNKIGMVHQHFMLVKPLTILENIILGVEENKAFGILDNDKAKKKIEDICSQYNININLDNKIENTPVGIQQRVEIVKLLFRDADILILDEPTAVLTPQETAELFKSLKDLKAKGKTIIIITHKLNEVLSVSDTVTVLRKGQFVSEIETAKTNAKELSGLMVGDEIKSSINKKQNDSDEIVLEIESLSVLNDKKIKSVNNVSFNIHNGEIFGIAGVEGNGQNELVETICGLRKIESGKIRLNNDSGNKSISHIPADRLKEGVVLDFSLSENVLLGRQDEAKFNKGFVIDEGRLKEFTKGLVDKYSVKTSGEDELIRKLSGGNQQKVVIARELTKENKLIVVNHPTRGLDIKATEFVHQSIINEREKDKGILLVSSDLSELLKLSDRIGVMFNGEITKIFNAYETNENEMGMYMTGGNK